MGGTFVVRAPPAAFVKDFPEALAAFVCIFDFQFPLASAASAPELGRALPPSRRKPTED